VIRIKKYRTQSGEHKANNTMVLSMVITPCDYAMNFFAVLHIFFLP